MRCVSCEISAAPYELRDGKCLQCLHKENGVLRGVIQKMDPLRIPIPAGQVINPEFIDTWMKSIHAQTAKDMLA